MTEMTSNSVLSGIASGPRSSKSAWRERLRRRLSVSARWAWRKLKRKARKDWEGGKPKRLRRRENMAKRYLRGQRWVVRNKILLLLLALFLGGLGYFIFRTATMPSGLVPSILMWAAVIGIPLLIISLLLLPVWLANRKDHPKKEKSSRTEKAVASLKETLTKKESHTTKTVQVVKHQHGLSNAFLGALFLIGVVAYAIWLYNHDQKRAPTRVATAPPAASAPVVTKANAPAKTGCSRAGETVAVSAPAAPDGDIWSDYVTIPAQCTPEPSIPHESGAYRFKCKDLDGNEQTEESGKCANGATALAFQKRQSSQVDGEGVPIDQYFVPVEFTITFKDLNG